MRKLCLTSLLSAIVGLTASAQTVGWTEDASHTQTTTTEKVGVGNTAPINSLHIGSSSSTGLGLTVQNGTGNKAYLTLSGSSNTWYAGLNPFASSGDPYEIKNSAGNGVTISTSGYLGLGTAPSYLLHVQGSAALLARMYNSSTTGDGLDLTTKSSSGSQNALLIRGNDGNTNVLSAQANGNVNIGSGTPGGTPLTWNSDYRSLLIGQTAIFAGRAGGASFQVGDNFYRNAATDYTYLVTGYANMLQTASGDWNFYTAPSGTTNTAITFTNRFTIKNGGSVGVATSSPTNTFQVGDSTTSGKGLTIQNGGGASRSAYMTVVGTNASSATQTWYSGTNVFATDGSYEIKTAGGSGLAITTSGGLKFGDGTVQTTAASNSAVAASNVTAGTFGTGNYVFPSSIAVNSQTNTSGTGITVGGTLVKGVDSQITGTGASNFGLVGKASGAGVDNYGAYLSATSGTGHNYALYVPYGMPSLGGNNYSIYSDSEAKSWFRGYIGVGTSTPNTPLHVKNITYSVNSPSSPVTATNADFLVERTADSQSAAIAVQGGSSATNGTGRVYLGNADMWNATYIEGGKTSSGPATFKVYVSQNSGSTPTAALTVNANGDLKVTGNIEAKYQDVAEWVPSNERLTAGTVVIINPLKNNEVMPSSHAYDTSVAGVVSDKPGVLLGEGSDTKSKIATTGRVRVHVDASKRAVNAGDLLVTSEKPGVAMASEPIDLGGVKIHRPGTLIGKALEPLPSGEGDILVLLSLQ